MTTELTAMMINPTAEHCSQCNEVILREPTVFDEFEEPYCTAECLEIRNECRNEAAYESFLEDFYGGSQPVTMEEQYQRAAEEKRKLR